MTHTETRIHRWAIFRVAVLLGALAAALVVLTVLVHRHIGWSIHDILIWCFAVICMMSAAVVYLRVGLAMIRAGEGRLGEPETFVAVLAAGAVLCAGAMFLFLQMREMTAPPPAPNVALAATKIVIATFVASLATYVITVFTVHGLTRFADLVTAAARRAITGRPSDR